MLYVDMPPEGAGGLRAILEAFTNALGLPVTLRMNNPLLIAMILKGLVAQRAELLLLDEFDQVFRENDKRLLEAGRSLIRKIADLGTLTIVCVGLDGVYGLLREDTQILGRGGLPFQRLRPYAWTSAEERLIYQSICDTFDQALPFDRQSGLGTSDFASRLHWAIKGNIGHLKFYMESAAAEAINEGADRIERSHFASVFDVRKPIGQTYNPFVHDPAFAPKQGAVEPGLKRGAARTVFSKKGEPTAGVQ